MCEARRSGVSRFRRFQPPSRRRRYGEPRRSGGGDGSAAVVTLTACLAAVALIAGCGPVPAGSAATIRGATPASPLTVVLSTDCGVDIDDQWALTHILLSPELRLKTIITTHAASIRFSSATSAAKASEVLARVDPARRDSIPVIAGSDAPLQDAGTPRSSGAVDALLALSRDFSALHRLVVLSIGAGTDVASAILRDPSIADRIAIVAMGFNGWPAGGEEFNIKNDPVAWRVILDSHVPLVVGSGSVAKRSLRLTSAQAARVMRSHGATGEYLYQLFDEWLTANSRLAAQMVSPGAWAVWDEVVVGYVLGLAAGDEVARPRLQAGFVFSHPKTSERITWITRIDAERLWRDFGRKLQNSVASSQL
jgi:inosine-uridine nucleoside N-ribohydrolase